MLLSLFLSIFSLHAAQATEPNIDWLCEGQTPGASHIAFNLILESHDGSRYTTARMDNFLLNGQEAGTIDIAKSFTFCGWDGDDREILGKHEWHRDGRHFEYVSYCPNGKFAFTADCRD